MKYLGCASLYEFRTENVSVGVQNILECEQSCTQYDTQVRFTNNSVLRSPNPSPNLEFSVAFWVLVDESTIPDNQPLMLYNTENGTLSVTYNGTILIERCNATIDTLQPLDTVWTEVAITTDSSGNVNVYMSRTLVATAWLNLGHVCKSPNDSYIQFGKGKTDYLVSKVAFVHTLSMTTRFRWCNTADNIF